MPLYFIEIDAGRFRAQLAPALTASWRQRSFAPCLPVAAELMEAGRAFVPAGRDEQPVLALLPGLPFDRDLWRLAAGEMLLFAVSRVPVVPTAPETLLALTGTPPAGPGRGSSAIAQAHFGSHDLRFGGGYYRPEQAGINHEDDVRRLADYLGGMDASQWQPAQLTHVSADERAEELDYARECLAALRDLYATTGSNAVVICEQL